MPERLSFPGGQRAAFFVALLGTLYAAYLVLRPVLFVFLIACAIASLSFGVYRRLTRWLHGRQRLAAGTTLFLLLGGVLAPLGVLAGVIGQRLVGELAAVAVLVRDPARASAFTDCLGRAGPWVEQALSRVAPALADAAPEIAHQTAELIASVGKSVLQTGILTFLLAVSLYYLYLDGERWRERLVRLVPLPPDDVRSFLGQFQRVSMAVLLGSFGTALTQAAVAGLGYFVFGVPLPLLWAALTFVAAFIPIVGTMLIWAPLAIWMAGTGQWWRAIALAIYGLAIVGTIDNVVRPLLTRRGLKIDPLLVFMGLFGGVAAYGARGLFLGPLAVALAVAVIDVYESRSPTLTTPT